MSLSQCVALSLGLRMRNEMVYEGCGGGMELMMTMIMMMSQNVRDCEAGQ